MQLQFWKYCKKDCDVWKSDLVSEEQRNLACVTFVFKHSTDDLQHRSDTWKHNVTQHGLPNRKMSHNTCQSRKVSHNNDDLQHRSDIWKHNVTQHWLSKEEDVTALNIKAEKWVIPESTKKQNTDYQTRSCHTTLEIKAEKCHTTLIICSIGVSPENTKYVTQHWLPNRKMSCMTWQPCMLLKFSS